MFKLQICPDNVIVNRCSVDGYRQLSGALVSFGNRKNVLITDYREFCKTYRDSGMTDADICYSVAVFAMNMGLSEI